ncbi:hypothetical protein [Sorangium sp. So ce1000]|uniref:hypothetical protein n=1 Tax=Sorangium sp. So ce1000 TaxID=3133325 RepID=UPI003F5E7F8D
MSVAFVSQREALVSGSADGTARAGGRVIGGYASAVEWLAASGEGEYVASACADGAVRVRYRGWDPW